MNGLHGIIFAYRKAPELRELVAHRTTASVPFGGRYRVIDFMLSAMQSAGVTDVGVLMQGNYQSLLDHLGNGKIWDMSRRFGGLKLLPAFDAERESFRGSMEALNSIRSYLDEIRQDYVVLCPGDVVVNLPFADVLKAHIESGADITAVCTERQNAVAEDATCFALDGDGAVRRTLYAPRVPEGHRSLGIYLLSRELLLRLVDECAERKAYSFRADVLQAMSDRLTIRAYVWNGYAAQLRTVREYYERSMGLLDSAVREELFCLDRPIRAKEEDDEGASYLAPEGRCAHSLIADGCTIEGTVEDSILFPGVHIGQGAQVKGCILFKNTTVSDGAILSHVITDKNVSVGIGRTLIGHETYPLVIGKGEQV